MAEDTRLISQTEAYFSTIRKRIAIMAERIIRHQLEKEERTIMTLMERKKRNERLRYMEEQISKRYATCEVNDKRCFVTSKGIVFSIFEFPSEDALCIEYADSQLEAK